MKYGLNKLSVGNNPFVTQYAEQLVNKTVHGILKDKQGNIWAGTTQGLIHLEVNTNKIEDYTFNDGLHNDEFADGAYFSDGNNQLSFGGVNGVILLRIIFICVTLILCWFWRV